MRALLLFTFCGLLPFVLKAQERTFLQKILPGHAVVQYAGNIGFLSAGVGFQSKNKKFNQEILYGYVPESIGGITIHSVTGKLTWLPLSKEYRKFSVNYLTAGLALNYVFGRQYFAFSPDNYPFNYYDFTTALFAGINAGQQINKGMLSLYYEIGTTDKELISFVGNTKSVEVSDILTFGAGIRIALK